jgi:acyl-CoA synthetase (AMP-forming)/AMP-acid ligase II
LDEYGGVKMVIRDNLLWIHPNTQTQKYLSSQNMFDEDGFINTGDLVDIRGDRVYFLGRESGAINVGGNKVQPEEVEAILLASDLVHSAFVYEKKSPMMGALVCADVVLSDKQSDKKIVKKEILAYCKAHLEAFKVPALLKIVDELSITHSGKLKRS